MTEYLLYMWLAWLCGGIIAFLLRVHEPYVHDTRGLWFMLVASIVCAFAYGLSLYYGGMAIYTAVTR